MSSYETDLVSELISKEANQKQREVFDKNIKGKKTMLDGS